MWVATTRDASHSALRAWELLTRSVSVAVEEIIRALGLEVVPELAADADATPRVQPAARHTSTIGALLISRLFESLDHVVRKILLCELICLNASLDQLEHFLLEDRSGLGVEQQRPG